MLGKLVVFEGVEGCGKTTQLQRLTQWLIDVGWSERLKQGLSQKANPVLVTREPGGTELGQRLRHLLLDPSTDEAIDGQAELLLYAADRAQHVATELKPHLAQGTLVLCDRYTDSTVAYQGYGHGLDLELIAQLNLIATGGLESDLTFWLDLDVEVGLERARQRQHPLNTGLDRMEVNDLDFHQRVQAGFKELARDYPERIIRIDANQAISAVSTQIQAIFASRLTAWYPQLSQT